MYITHISLHRCGVNYSIYKFIFFIVSMLILVILLIGGVTSLFNISSLIVPFVKKEYGFKKSIINTQLISVLVQLKHLLQTTIINIILLYTSPFFFTWWGPLMNMKQLINTETTMNYVGKNNQRWVQLWLNLSEVGFLVLKYLNFSLIMNIFIKYFI